MEEELINKGKQLVAELGKERELSSRWMAHYVAELMGKAGSRDKITSQEAAGLCAELIIKLWEIRIKNRITEIERELQIWFKNRPDYDCNDRHEILKAALDNPELISKEVNLDTALNLRTLRDVEEDLLQLWLVIEAIAKPDDQKMSEIASNFSKADSEALKINERLTRLFPQFATLSLTDVEKGRSDCLVALQRIDQLRNAVLFQQVEASKTNDDKKLCSKDASEK